MAILIGLNYESVHMTNTTQMCLLKTGTKEELVSLWEDVKKNKNLYESRLKEIEKGRKRGFFIGTLDIKLIYGENYLEREEIMRKLSLFNYDKIIVIEGDILL